MRVKPLTWNESLELIRQHSETVAADCLVEDPIVSVSVVTYNHGPYLARCLDNVLAQQTDFPFEVVIGEDFSSDNTREIALSYQRSHPGNVRINLSTSRALGDRTRSGRLNYFRNLLSCRGTYIALIEGDDYWTDRRKLQRQVDYLYNHPESAGCFHESVTVDEEGRSIQHAFKNRGYQPSYSQADCLNSLYSGYATASLMFRTEVLTKPFPSYMLAAHCDELLDLFITANGTLDYLPESMAAYRVHTGGLWQGAKNERRAEMLLLRAEALWNDPTMNSRHKEDIDARLRLDWGRLWRAGSRDKDIPLMRTLKIVGRAEAPRLATRLRWLLAEELRHLRKMPQRIRSCVLRAVA